MANHFLLPAFAAMLLALPATAQEFDARLNETVIMIPKRGTFATPQLETTIFRPEGAGPFPVVIINHGKALGDSRYQARYRPLLAAQYFMRRGYLVAVPMRQGFSKSTGLYVGAGCNVESNGRVQAEDVVAVLQFLAAQPHVDKSRILVIGQSHGGWTTLAFGALNYPGVKGLVNFAGGLRQEGCGYWQGNLVRSIVSYGRETKLPALWFYGDNDSYFAPDTFRPMHAAYTASGASARLVAFGMFGGDAHGMFGARAGQRIWQPEMTRFLGEIGLPAEVVLPQYGDLEPPPRTDFAAVADVDALPHVREAARTGYSSFLARPSPRAFAIAPNGAWGSAWLGIDEPLRRALQNCNKSGNGACKLYAVDDFVVWQKPVD